MDQRADAIRARLEWYARQRQKSLSDVFSLKFRPVKSDSIPNPTGYMYPGEYRFALSALPHQQAPDAKSAPLWRGSYPMGDKPVHVIPSYGDGMWVQHETGLELLLTFEFIETVKTMYETSKGFVELTGNPMLLVDMLGTAVGINSGKVPASTAGDKPPKNDRYEGHRDVEAVVVEKRSFREDGTISEETIVKVPLSANLSADEHATLLAKLARR